jgi:hypothetical protein
MQSVNLELTQRAISVTRHRLPGEIVPVRAEQSSTFVDDFSLFGAQNAIDLNFDTMAQTKSDGTPLFKVILDKVYCVEKIVWFVDPPQYATYFSATCSNTGCSTCQGRGCPYYIATVSTERTYENLPTVSSCRFGDTVTLKSRIGGNVFVTEIAIIGKQGEITHWYVRYVCTLRNHGAGKRDREFYSFHTLSISTS